MLLPLNRLQKGGPWPRGCGPVTHWLHSQRWVTGSLKQASPCHSPLLRITAWIIPSPPQVHGTVVFHETAPWCQRLETRQTTVEVTTSCWKPRSPSDLRYWEWSETKPTMSPRCGLQHFNSYTNLVSWLEIGLKIPWKFHMHPTLPTWM